MSDIKIVIIDYGLGNIFNIQRAITFLGYDSSITDKSKEIFDADKIILPGVGAFGDGMKSLEEKKLDKVLFECAESKKSIIGICLGMQLLMSESEEFGRHQGLNIISGRVTRFPGANPEGLKNKIPHVGWNQIFPVADNDAWNGTFLKHSGQGDFFYFSHSYVVTSEDKNNILAKTIYGGIEFCSVIKKNNISGCQFHPELSGENGLKILKEFIEGKV